MTQQSLFHPGSGGREEFQVRLHTHKGDPETSQEAARRLVATETLTLQQVRAAWMVRKFGPATTWEIAGSIAETSTGYRPPVAEEIHYMLARRLPELERKGLVRVQRDKSGKEVVRQKSRVWEIVPNG